MTQVSKSSVFWKKKQNPQKQQALFPQKTIPDFAETSLIISSKINFPNLSVLRKTFFIEKYSNFNFQNQGFWEKKPQIS